ncbi:MAG: glutaredoxin family protein [Armatimonadota bacterium]|nr:glutaredoxin family protein [Armatimonadota bacterium]
MNALRFTVYGKPGCALCEKALDAIRILSRTYPLQLTYVNILEDPGLYARYHDRIPVVLLEGEEVAEGRVSFASIEAIVRSRFRGIPRGSSRV